MTHHNVSYLKYIQIGFEMLILCLILIYIYLSYFQEKINASKSSNYVKASCQLVNLTQFNVPFYCVNKDSGLVSSVDLPCIYAYVNVTSLLNEDGTVLRHFNKYNYTFKLYRNIDEHIYSHKNDLDCSYLPTACDNDANYMAKYLGSSYSKLFPAPDKQFVCFIHTITNLINLAIGSEIIREVLSSSIKQAAVEEAIMNKNDDIYVLLTKPDFIAYYTSIAVISIGFALSISIFFYGIFNLRTFKKKRKIHELRSTLEAENLLSYFKKVLSDTHVDFDDETNRVNTIEIELTDESENGTIRSTKSNKLEIDLDKKEIKFDTNEDNKTTKTSQAELITYKDLSLKQKANKIKLGDSKYNINRIDYKRPSSSRLSSLRSSVKSETSVEHDKDHEQLSNRFFLEPDDNSSEDHELSMIHHDPIVHHNYHHHHQQQHHEKERTPPVDDLSIPDVIIEEDERNLTVNRTLNNTSGKANKENFPKLETIFPNVEFK